jgi:hypothetical protein
MTACLMPMNPVDASRKKDSFVETVLPRVSELGMAQLAMKTLAFGHFFGSNSGDSYRDDDPAIPNYLSVEEALWFVLSLPVASLLSGMDSAALVRQNIDTVRRFRALTDADRGALIDKVSALAGRAQLEWYRG